VKPLTDINDPRLVKALAHPLRVKILGVLETRVASPNEMSQLLGEPLGTVSYHVRQLADFGLVKLVDTAPRRGAIEHYYRAEARPRVTDRAWREAPEIVRQALIGASLAEISNRVNAGAAAGGFSREGAHLARMPVTVDQQGWDELAGAVGNLIEEVQRITGESEKRLAKADHEDERQASLVLMLFENGERVDVDGNPTHKTTTSGTRGRRRPRVAS
jgi:DNA-binding transcriptional ArsR family regulator